MVAAVDATTANKQGSARARERLLDAALARFAGGGPDRPTLEQIRTDAGVSVGALYHHFADRRELATALYLRTLDEYQRGFAAALREHPGAREAITETVRFHVDWCARHPDRARFLLHGRSAADEATVAAAAAPFLREVMAWYRGHAHYGAVRDLPFDLVEALWLGPAQEWTRHHLAERSRAEPPEVAAGLALGAWRALRSTPEGVTDDR